MHVKKKTNYQMGFWKDGKCAHDNTLATAIGSIISIITNAIFVVLSIGLAEDNIINFLKKISKEINNKNNG